jgi:hypothetical protein
MMRWTGISVPEMLSMTLVGFQFGISLSRLLASPSCHSWYSDTIMTAQFIGKFLRSGKFQNEHPILATKHGEVPLCG